MSPVLSQAPPGGLCRGIFKIVDATATTATQAGLSWVPVGLSAHEQLLVDLHLHWGNVVGLY